MFFTFPLKNKKGVCNTKSHTPKNAGLHFATTQKPLHTIEEYAKAIADGIIEELKDE